MSFPCKCALHKIRCVSNSVHESNLSNFECVFSLSIRGYVLQALQRHREAIQHYDIAIQLRAERVRFIVNCVPKLSFLISFIEYSFIFYRILTRMRLRM